jgi:hypothetical protein
LQGFFICFIRWCWVTIQIIRRFHPKDRKAGGQKQGDYYRISLKFSCYQWIKYKLILLKHKKCSEQTILTGWALLCHWIKSNRCIEREMRIL